MFGTHISANEYFLYSSHIPPPQKKIKLKKNKIDNSLPRGKKILVIKLFINFI